jgi:hypothetical protein
VHFNWRLIWQITTGKRVASGRTKERLDHRKLKPLKHHQTRALVRSSRTLLLGSTLVIGKIHYFIAEDHKNPRTVAHCCRSMINWKFFFLIESSAAALISSRDNDSRHGSLKSFTIRVNINFTAAVAKQQTNMSSRKVTGTNFMMSIEAPGEDDHFLWHLPLPIVVEYVWLPPGALRTQYNALDIMFCLRTESAMAVYSFIGSDHHLISFRVIKSDDASAEKSQAFPIASPTLPLSSGMKSAENKPANRYAIH